MPRKYLVTGERRMIALGVVATVQLALRRVARA
jgi:hypothetical protein